MEVFFKFGALGALPISSSLRSPMCYILRKEYEQNPEVVFRV
jgi:hypothetical protein